MELEEILQDITGVENPTQEQLQGVLDKVVTYTKQQKESLTNLLGEKDKLSTQVSDLQKRNHDYFVRLHGTKPPEKQENETKVITDEDILKTFGGII